MLSMVGFGGKMAAGKTSAAIALVEELNFRKIALADEVKRVGNMVADWIPKIFDERWAQGKPLGMKIDWHSVLREVSVEMKDKSTPAGRAWLQFIGTDCMRSVLPDIWIQALLRNIEGSPLVVVDDVRFINEASSLRVKGFKVARIETADEVRLERIGRMYPEYDSGHFNHSSERQIEDYGGWDAVFDGGLPLEEFQKQIVRWVQDNEQEADV